jgi:hypothetical protein
MEVPSLLVDGVNINPLDANSYRVLENMKRGLDPEANKNTKVTMELLQKMDYKDLKTNDDDNFKPTDVIAQSEPGEDSPSDDDSVFDYLFPDKHDKKEEKKLKSNKAVVGKNEFSEKVYNLKKEAKK